MAVKLIPERNEGEEHEEVILHKTLNHENIVKYIGSHSEDGYFDDFCLIVFTSKENCCQQCYPTFHFSQIIQPTPTMSTGSTTGSY